MARVSAGQGGQAFVDWMASAFARATPMKHADRMHVIADLQTALRRCGKRCFGMSIVGANWSARPSLQVMSVKKETDCV